MEGDTEPVYEKLRKNLETLAAYGCKAAAVPCNTSHYFLEKLENEVNVCHYHALKEKKN